MPFNESQAPLPGLEWAAEYDIFTDIKVLEEAISTIAEIEHLYQGFIRFLLIVKEDYEIRHWAKILPILPHFLKDKIRFNVFCIQGFSKDLPTLPQGWTYGGDISSYEDCVNLIQSNQPVDFLEFRMTDNNFQELVKGFYFLRGNRFNTSFMTFKMDHNAPFTSELQAKIKGFFQDEIDKYYFYDVMKQQVYNNAAFCALKNIRPFQVYQKKYIPGQMTNVVQNHLGDIRETHGNTSMPAEFFSASGLKKQVFALAESNKLNELPAGRRLDDRCDTCQHKKFCQGSHSEIINIKPFECENTKFGIFIQELLETTPASFEKFQFFQKEENRISA